MLEENRYNNYGKIGKYIFLNITIVPFIPFILIMGIGCFYFLSSLANTSVSSISRIVNDHRQMIESFLTERRSDLEFILNSYTFEELSQPETLEKIYSDLQIKSTAFTDLGIFNESGVHVAYQGGYRLSGKVYKNADWFKEVLKNGYYISDIFLGYRQKPHFILAVAKEADKQKYIIRVTIDSKFFSSMVRQIRIGSTGEAYILNRDGFFQTERRSGGNLMEKDPDFAQYPSFSTGIETFLQKNAQGIDFQCAAMWMEGNRWLLVVRQEKADAFRTFRIAAFLGALIAIIGGAVIIAMSYYISNRIVNRIKSSDSERDRLQEQLIMAGRLAELGEMSAGFAHEINNPLQIIKNEISLIEITLQDIQQAYLIPESDEIKDLKDFLRQISLQINRCSSITHSILKFGRKTEHQIKTLKPGTFIPEITEMVKKKASINGVELSLKIDDDAPVFLGDPSQLQQILLNLYNNAFDAVIEKCGTSGGKLDVTAGSNGQGGVMIQFRDNGCGITPDNMKKIFSPFFTTKPVGKGTGLGLSICYGLVKGMGGDMKVESEAGVGSVFTLTFPAAS